MQIKFSKSNVFTVKLLGESRGGGGGSRGWGLSFVWVCGTLTHPPSPTHYPFQEASNTNFKKINFTFKYQKHK